jgi:putative SOS response-associated peptidase YedK
MCNLYSLTRNVDAIRALFRVPHNRAPVFDPLPAIFPGWTAPVIRKAADGDREMVPMSWGFVLLQEGKAPRRVTNVRDDKILTSKFWKPSFEARRCLVPASSYSEPDSGKPAQWHWFAVNGDDDRQLFAFPGIWQRWKGPVKKDGPNVELDVYSFMTTAPNALTDTINHERMPVLLSEEADFETWLSGSPAAAFALARSFDPAAMRIVQSGFEKKDLLAA